MMMPASWQRQTIADIQVCLGGAQAQTEASVNSQYLLNTQSRYMATHRWLGRMCCQEKRI